MSKTDETSDERTKAAIERRRLQNRQAQRNYRNNIKQRLSQLEWLDNAISKGLEIVPMRPGSSDQVNQRAVQQIVPALPTPQPQPSLEQTDQGFYWPQAQNQIQLESIVPQLDVSTYVHSADHITDASQLQYNNYPLIMSPSQNTQPRIEDAGNKKLPSMQPCQVHHGSQSSLDKITVDANTYQTPPTSEPDFSTSKRSNSGGTAIFRAARNGHTGVVKVLLERGARSDARDENGQTLLHIAAERGYEEVAKLLIAEGVDVDATDNNGCTSLILAAEAGRESMVELLVDAGASIDNIE